MTCHRGASGLQMETPRDIFSKMEKKINERAGEFSKLGGVYKFVLNGQEGGTWIVDLRKESFGVRENDEEAQCGVTISSEDFVKIATGKLKAESAFMMGRIKFTGDLGMAMKLGKLFSK